MNNRKPAAQLKSQHILELFNSYKQALSEHRSYVDSLNVYPVPDGDTGTNMFLTMESVLTELESLEGIGDMENLESICKAAIKGAVMGARGNSGVILSQILKGMLETFIQYAENIDAGALAKACTSAAESAYSAVSEPVEGTILTVIREVSEEAEKTAKKDTDLSVLISSLQAAGSKSLQNTPELLEVLKKAGVVDAGGAGLLLLFDALAFVVDGRQISPPPASDAEVLDTGSGAQNGSEIATGLPHNADKSQELGTRYEVMYLLSAEESDIPAFRKTWEGLGDSIVISGTEGIWNCHIHTDEIGMTIEAGIACGTPQNIKITDLHEQVSHNDQHLGMQAEPETAARDADKQTGAHQAQARQAEADKETADADQSGELLLLSSLVENPKTQIVVTGQGEGLAELFGSLGARVMVVGGQTNNPSTQLLLDAINMLSAEEAVILPNNSNICATAKMAVQQAERPVSLVETKSIMEGVAVLLAYDPMASAKKNVEQMEAVKSRVVSGEVTRAVRDSEELGIKKGDYIGLDSKEVLSVDASLVHAVCSLLEKITGEECEIITLVTGIEAKESETQKILKWIKENRPEIEAEVCYGGQNLYHYYIGIE